MKAPELPTKIYFTILDMGSGYVYTPSLDDNGGTEYIRKDALMKWIQEARAIPHENAITRDLVFQEVVNKLNSM